MVYKDCPEENTTHHTYQGRQLILIRLGFYSERCQPGPCRKRQSGRLRLYPRLELQTPCEHPRRHPLLSSGRLLYERVG